MYTVILSNSKIKCFITKDKKKVVENCYEVKMMVRSGFKVEKVVRGKGIRK